MSGIAAVVVVIVLLLDAGMLAVFVGFRRRAPWALDALRWMTKVVFNPFEMKRAGRAPLADRRARPVRIASSPRKIRAGANQLRQAMSGRLLDGMPGASEQTRRVQILNVNWVAGADGDDGRFEVMVVTEDDQQHIIAPSPASITALIPLTQADTVLMWDPSGRTLIAANVVGTMPWTERA